MIDLNAHTVGNVTERVPPNPIKPKTPPTQNRINIDPKLKHDPPTKFHVLFDLKKVSQSQRRGG